MLALSCTAGRLGRRGSESESEAVRSLPVATADDDEGRRSRSPCPDCAVSAATEHSHQSPARLLTAVTPRPPAPPFPPPPPSLALLPRPHQLAPSTPTHTAPTSTLFLPPTMASALPQPAQDAAKAAVDQAHADHLKDITVLSDPTNFTVKHPLYSAWTLSFDSASKQDKAKSWEDAIVPVASFADVESFWSLNSAIVPPSTLGQNANYYLFKQGIKPAWEDDANAQGGKWSVQLPRGKYTDHIDRFWLYTVRPLSLCPLAFRPSSGLTHPPRPADARRHRRDVRDALRLALVRRRARARHLDRARTPPLVLLERDHGRHRLDPQGLLPPQHLDPLVLVVGPARRRRRRRRRAPHQEHRPPLQVRRPRLPRGRHGHRPERQGVERRRVPEPRGLAEARASLLSLALALALVALPRRSCRSLVLLSCLQYGSKSGGGSTKWTV